MTSSLTTATADYRILLDSSKNSFTLYLGERVLSGCKSTVLLADQRCPVTHWTMLSPGVWRGSWEKGAVVLSSCIQADEIQLDMQLETQELHADITLEGLCVAHVECDHVVVHGRSMSGCDIMIPSKKNGETFESVFFNGLSHQGKTLLASQPLTQPHLLRMSGQCDDSGVNTWCISTSFTHLAAGTHNAGVTALRWLEDGHQGVESYIHSQRPQAHTIKTMPVGWNSWDYYRWTITEDEVIKNVDAIADDEVLSRHVKRITIDDGWQYCYGEWDANSLFPRGMEWMAKSIKDKGFEPGLWIAPSIVEPHSRIAQIEPDMLACGKSGAPSMVFKSMMRPTFVLDPTLPKVQDWIFNLFSRYCDYGYEFFKLDFLAATLRAPIFAHKDVPRGEIIRALVSPIRAATQGRAQLLGCNYNFEAGLDLVDSVRTSSDIHVTWGSIKSNAKSIAMRTGFQNVLWDNDPDFAICRGPETSDDPLNEIFKPCNVFNDPESDMPHPGYKSLATATYDEAQVLLSLVVISGGTINLSDCIYKLNESGMDLLRKTVSAERGEGGKALDLFTSEHPAYWIQRVSTGWRVLMVNWTDCDQDMSVSLKANGIKAQRIRNFWTDEVSNGQEWQESLQVSLKPHSCYLAEVAI